MADRAGNFTKRSSQPYQVPSCSPRPPGLYSRVSRFLALTFSTSVVDPNSFFGFGFGSTKFSFRIRILRLIF
jgi:hypothetical protein